jgi:protein CLEC16A
MCVNLILKSNHNFTNFSIDYLLSNNHVNNIILHKFDFSDEEITAYYISFLKTLSLKLNKHSINFFYNEVCPKMNYFSFQIRKFYLEK